MSEHFIRYIDIESYKCFQSFSAKGFKRVNLVSGKNNIGKTALMEAISINTHSRNLFSLLTAFFHVYFFRQQIDHPFGKPLPPVRDILSYFMKDSLITLKSNQWTVSCKGLEEKLSGKYEVNFGDKNEVFSLNDVNVDYRDIFSAEIKNVEMIGKVGFSQSQIKNAFIGVQLKDSEDFFNKIIHAFDDNILSIKVIGDKVQCKVLLQGGESYYRDINEFGDGLRHYVSIAAALFSCADGYLLIDEVENGVHYSLLDDLWKTILTLSKEMNVQVFATTHSRECIESYCRVAKSLNEQDISFTTLVRNKESQIKAIVRDYEVFTNSIDQGHEVRGW